MFCPKCGLQQVSDVARFCPRCGLQLSAVAELASGDGQWPAYLNPAGAPGPSPRRRGVRQGVGLMLMGIFLAAMFGILMEILNIDTPLPLLGLLAFLLGFLRVIYAMFEDKAPTLPHALAPPYAPPASQTQFGAQHRGAALPPQPPAPAPTLFGGRRDTAQVGPPASVTDHTTRLLEADPDRHER